MQPNLPFLVMAFFLVFETLTFPLSRGEQPTMAGSDGQFSQVIGGSGRSMRVLWTISGYKRGEGAAWEDEEARKLLFKPLDIDATQITFDGRTCHDVIFEKKTLKAKEYFENVYRTPPQAVGITEELIEVVKTNCSLPGFAEYIRLKDRRLMIHLNGVFFYFEPAVNY